MLTSMCVFRLYYANASVKYGTAALIATFPPSTLKMWQWRMSLIEIWIVSHCVNSETGDDKSILSVRASVVSLFLFITVSLTPALFPLSFFFCLSTCWYYEGGEGWNGADAPLNESLGPRYCLWGWWKDGEERRGITKRVNGIEERG